MLPVPLNSWKISSSMRLPVSISAVATIVSDACFFGVARGREKFSRNFHRARVDTAAHGATATARRIVKSARRAGDRIEQNENILACFDETFRALDRELGDARVALDIAVVRARHEFGLRTRTAEIGHFFRTFIDQENDQFHLRMILHDRVGDVMQQASFCRCEAARQSGRAGPCRAASSNP